MSGVGFQSSEDGRNGIKGDRKREKFLDLIADEMKAAFAGCGYEESYAKVVLSNRPDLCEYQCNGAMAAAKPIKETD